MNLINSILLFMLLLSFSCKQKEGDLSDDNRLKYLALGDSYTIGEGVAEEARWPVQLAHEFRRSGLNVADPDIIAKTGWTTNDLLTAIKAQDPEKDYHMVSLLIGVNNQYQKQPITIYEEQFKQLVKKAISLTKGNDPKRVLVLSIPDYGFTPFGAENQEQITEELNNYNAINKQVSEDLGVWYVNITDISRQGLENPDLVADDNLHPSALQYKLWVERILEKSNFIAYLRQQED